MTKFQFFLNPGRSYEKMIEMLEGLKPEPKFTLQYYHGSTKGIGWIESAEYIRNFLLFCISRFKILNKDLITQYQIFPEQLEVFIDKEFRIPKTKTVHSDVLVYSEKGFSTVSLCGEHFWVFPSIAQAVSFYEYLKDSISNKYWRIVCRRDHPEMKHIMKYVNNDGQVRFGLFMTDLEFKDLLQEFYLKSNRTANNYEINEEKLTVKYDIGTYYFESMNSMTTFRKIIQEAHSNLPNI